MYAVVKTGGKQYKVQSNDVILAEKLDVKAGDKIKLDQVLAVGTGKDLKLGSPLVDKAFVEAEVVEQTRGEKITVFKKKRRKNYRRTKGHRQDLTVLRVLGISADGKAAQKTEKPAAKKAAAAADKKPAAKKEDAKPEAKAKPAADKETKSKE
jgi:large subunit ribosomal protein L21